MAQNEEFNPAKVARALLKVAKKRFQPRPVRSPPDHDWDGRYQAAMDFAQKHGHVRMSHKQNWNGKNIGNWVYNHRVWYREGVLSPSKIALIEAIPHWNWNPGKPDWHANFEKLKQAMEKFGHASFGISAEYDGVKIGKWARNQRDRYVEGSLSQEQVDLLNSLPGWVWSLRGLTPLPKMDIDRPVGMLEN